MSEELPETGKPVRHGTALERLLRRVADAVAAALASRRPRESTEKASEEKRP